MLAGRKCHLQTVMVVMLGKAPETLGVIEVAVLVEVVAKPPGAHLRKWAILLQALPQLVLQLLPRKRKGDQVVWLLIFFAVPSQIRSGLSKMVVLNGLLHQRSRPTDPTSLRQGPTGLNGRSLCHDPHLRLVLGAKATTLGIHRQILIVSMVGRCQTSCRRRHRCRDGRQPLQLQLLPRLHPLRLLLQARPQAIHRHSGHVLCHHDHDERQDEVCLCVRLWSILHLRGRCK